MYRLEIFDTMILSKSTSFQTIVDKNLIFCFDKILFTFARSVVFEGRHENEKLVKGPKFHTKT